MRVYKRQIRCPRSLILNLDDIGKSSKAVGLHKEFGCYRVSAVGAIERPLCGSDRIVVGDRRIYIRGTSLIKLAWLTTPK
jgi:hypothetical protein